MTSEQFRVRRATLDDIAALNRVWSAMRFATESLARRVTEFQVVEDQTGQVVGALGMEISEKQGRIHSEGFLDFAQAEAIRPLLWERLQSVANNHGLLRLWTREDAPFWHRCGMIPANPEIIEKLPAAWKPLGSQWLTLKLKEDLESVLSADAEFALFMQSEKERTARAFRQAKMLKFIAILLAAGLLVVVMIGAFYILRNNPSLLRR